MAVIKMLMEELTYSMLSQNPHSNTVTPDNMAITI
jgi:hypothetical protein